MICPFCGREMKIGTMDTPSGFGNIEWYPETEKILRNGFRCLVDGF